MLRTVWPLCDPGMLDSGLAARWELVPGLWPGCYDKLLALVHLLGLA